MTNTEIIYKAAKSSGVKLVELELEKIETNCMLCGKRISKGTKYRKVVSSNFTDYDEFQYREGSHICRECGSCIKTRELRTHNILADKDNIYLFKKKELEEMIMNIDKYVEGEFVIAFTRSFKKHNSYRTTVNTDTDLFFIREEDKEYLFDRKQAVEIYKILNEMYLYFTKDELSTGHYSMANIQEFGVDKFSEYEKEIKIHRNTHQLEFLIYMLDSEKRNEIVQERIKEQKEEKARLKKLEKEKLKAEKEKNKNKQMTLL